MIGILITIASLVPEPAFIYAGGHYYQHHSDHTIRVDVRGVIGVDLGITDRWEGVLIFTNPQAADRLAVRLRAEAIRQNININYYACKYHQVYSLKLGIVREVRPVKERSL